MSLFAQEWFKMGHELLGRVGWGKDHCLLSSSVPFLEVEAGLSVLQFHTFASAYRPRREGCQLFEWVYRDKNCANIIFHMGLVTYFLAKSLQTKKCHCQMVWLFLTLSTRSDTLIDSLSIGYSVFSRLNLLVFHLAVEQNILLRIE